VAVVLAAAPQQIASAERRLEAAIHREQVLGDVKGARPVFRLSPPRSGFGQIKRPFPKGSIGFRKDGMDELVLRMV